MATRARVLISFGPTGRDEVTIRDEHGNRLDLPIKALSVSLPGPEGTCTATLTVVMAHVDARAMLTIKRFEEPRPRWWRRLGSWFPLLGLR